MSTFISLLRDEKSIKRRDEEKWAWFGAKEAMRLTGVCHEDVEFDDLLKEEKIDRQIMILPNISNISGDHIRIVKDFVSQGGLLITEVSESIREVFKLKMVLKKSPDKQILKMTGIVRKKDEQMFNGITSEYLPLFNVETLYTSEYEKYGSIIDEKREEGLFLTRIPIGKGMLWCLPPGFFFTIGIILSGLTSKYARQPKQEEKFFSISQSVPINSPIGFFDPVVDEWLVFWVNLLTAVADSVNLTFPLVSYLPEGKGAAAVLRHDWDGMIEDDCLNELVKLEKKLGIPTTSLFICMVDEDVYPMKPPNYDVQDKKVLNYIKSEIERGCEVGIHHACWRPEVVKAEHRRFVEKTGVKPIVNTDHWTQGSGLTLRTYEELGYIIDGSMTSYASWDGLHVFENPHRYPGFLTGTVRLHDLFDPQRANLLKIVEFPTFAEEHWLEGKGMNVPLWSDIEKYFDVIERHQGAIFIEYHPNLYPDYSILEKVVNYLKKRNFWFTTMSNIAKRWENTRVIKLDVEKVEDGSVEIILSSSNKIDGLTVNIPNNWEIEEIEAHGKTITGRVVIHNREYTQLIMDHLDQTRITMKKLTG